MSGGLVDTSGGLVWHGRALRYRQLWVPFAARVRQWLDAWHPLRSALLLIGPSAGHTLPTELLNHLFPHIHAVEPDPLARGWLRLRLPGVQFLPHGPMDANGLEQLAARARERHAALLFCNLLGQLPPPDGMSWSDALSALPADLPWASYHDVLSTTRSPDRHGDSGPQPDFDSLVAHYWQGGTLEVTDHQTFSIGSPESRRYTLWPLRPGQWHVVGWGQHRPP